MSAAPARAARAVLAALVLACAGCSTTAPGLPGPTAHLPLALAGIADARAAFAALFQAELQAQGWPEAGAGGPWLALPPEGAAAPPERLSALREVFRARAASTSVLLVPGLFGDCVDAQALPFGDGLPRPREQGAVEAYAGYADLGLKSLRLILLPGRVSTTANGARVAQVLRDEAARPGVDRIVLVGYSKGTADAMEALASLQAAHALPPAVSALVSVSGAVMGSPLADRFEGLYAGLSPLAGPFGCSASDGQDLHSMGRPARLAWLQTRPLPAQVALYDITASASPALTSPLLRPFLAQLSALDPRNDGQMLASDALLPHSTLLAEARADHWDVALPLDRHPRALMRLLASGRPYPREALLRAVLLWVVGGAP